LREQNNQGCQITKKLKGQFQPQVFSKGKIPKNQNRLIFLKIYFKNKQFNEMYFWPDFPQTGLTVTSQKRSKMAKWSNYVDS
jgi:hypothetical protein